MAEKTKVGIAVSAIGQMPTVFVSSLTELIKKSTAEDIVIEPLIDIQKPLDKSRNYCVKKLLEKEVDYVFFMDTDMVFKPESLLELLKQEKDIATGVYCYKRPPYSPVLRMLDEEEKRYIRVWDYPRGKLFQVDGCGAGCLLVKREVFEKLDEPWFRFTPKTSEDFYFCRKAREAGYEIWANGKLECGHISEYVPVLPENFWSNKDLFKKKLEKDAMEKFGDYDQASEEVKT